ncbi:ferritin-like domain-containing protein [Desulfitibacter alkalitolerans]|uniref:ferritin-like domain-containing protein n=1 Tax=Desulfitibacter alkalitolerans TaxID=264641 RepID=UPI00047F5D17|nr:ferritin-like domain-containing protein [Desulfitibacter alkalitolerans]
MNQQQIINKLNWFYSLELNQVDLYMAQSKRVGDIYFSKVFERAAYIEQQHVDNIAEKIKELGSKPTILGDVMAPILGKISGNIVSTAGILPMLKANILLEQKAISDYKDFILKAGKDPELFNLLWSNLIDEDFHVSWFSRKVQELEEKPH